MNVVVEPNRITSTNGSTAFEKTNRPVECAQRSFSLFVLIVFILFTNSMFCFDQAKKIF